MGEALSKAPFLSPSHLAGHPALCQKPSLRVAREVRSSVLRTKLRYSSHGAIAQLPCEKLSLAGYLM
jgi:hypothetical protein